MTEKMRPRRLHDLLSNGSVISGWQLGFIAVVHSGNLYGIFGFLSKKKTDSQASA